jgi:hypothetical protein
MQVHSSCLFQSLPERPATIACPRHCSEEVCRAAIVEEQVGPLPVGRNKTRQDKTRQDKTGQEGHSRKRQRRHKATGHAQQRHVALQSNPATSDETPTASNMLYLAIIQSMCLPATDKHGAPIRHRYRIIVGRLLDL